MPPRVAALACFLFVGYLFREDFRQPDRQRISWAPLIWMFIAGSRFVSHWLNLGSPQGSNAWDEGSPVDRSVFLSLIAWGAIVLSRRSINWSRLLRDNWLIAAYLLYCLASLLWTDEPFVLTKRWMKDLGNPIMALVLLTERRPYEAVATTLRRLSFLLLPFSVLFIKYYPELGRAYSRDWELMYTGVAGHKNTLGMGCLITGTGIVWKLMQPRLGGRSPAERTWGIDSVLIGMLAWLLWMANSQTSTACLVLAVGVLIAMTIPSLSSRPSRLVDVIAIGALTYGILQVVFNINAYVYALMGRSPTLTNRAEIWKAVEGLQGSPLVGVGFMSFWNPERLAAFENAIVDANIQQAHNGYLEQYVNLGYVGVAFILAIMAVALVDIRRHLDRDPSPALLRLCFLLTAVLYNYTEASFYGINNMWVLLLTASITITQTLATSSRVPGVVMPPGPGTTHYRRKRYRE